MRMAFTIDTKPGSASARLDIKGVFSASELEQVIADLARARAMMHPAVPREPEQTADPHVDLQSDPRFIVSEAPGHGGVVLRLRDAGAGWRAFALPYSEAGRLGALLDEWSRR